MALGAPPRRRRQIVRGDRTRLRVHHNVGTGKLRLDSGLGPIGDLVTPLQRLVRIEDQSQVYEKSGPATAHAHLLDLAHVSDLGRVRNVPAQLRRYGIQQLVDRLASQLQADPHHHARHTERGHRIGLGQPRYFKLVCRQHTQQPEKHDQ